MLFELLVPSISHDWCSLSYCPSTQPMHCFAAQLPYEMVNYLIRLNESFIQSFSLAPSLLFIHARLEILLVFELAELHFDGRVVLRIIHHRHLRVVALEGVHEGMNDFFLLLERGIAFKTRGPHYKCHIHEFFRRSCINKMEDFYTYINYTP